MPLVKTIKDGNTTTEIHDEMEGLGKLSADEVLAKTGSKAGQFTEIQPDGSKITYFVEEVRILLTSSCASEIFCKQFHSNAYAVNSYYFLILYSNFIQRRKNLNSKLQNMK